MELEILDHTTPDDGEPEPLSRSAWLLLAAFTAFCLLGGVLLVGGTDPATPQQQLAVAPFSPLPELPEPTLSVSLVGLGDNLVLGSTCMPLERADRTFSISFEVMNASRVDITVNALALGSHNHGLGDLRPSQTTVGGTCGEPGTQPVGGLIPVGQSQLFTFWFRRTGRCPQSQQAQVPVRATQMAGMTTTAVRRDIGTLYFNNNCPVSPGTGTS